MIILAALASVTMTAEEADAEQESCIEAVTTYADHDYGTCTLRRIERADERLNARWKELMELVGRNSEIGQRLVSEERAWVLYKEAACEFYLVEGSGTADRFLFHPSCQLEIIENRVTALEQIIEYVRGPQPD